MRLTLSRLQAFPFTHLPHFTFHFRRKTTASKQTTAQQCSECSFGMRKAVQNDTQSSKQQLTPKQARNSHLITSHFGTLSVWTEKKHVGEVEKRETPLATTCKTNTLALSLPPVPSYSAMSNQPMIIKNEQSLLMFFFHNSEESTHTLTHQQNIRGVPGMRFEACQCPEVNPGAVRCSGANTQKKRKLNRIDTFNYLR